MKTVRDVKALFRDAAIGTHPAADRAVLADALQAGGLTSQTRPARSQRKIWRFLMESRMTKLAAAVLVLAAAVLAVHYFDGTAVKAVEFSEIAKAMGEVPWMHASGSGFERGLTGVADQWIGFQSKIQAGRWADGKASFWNLREHRRAEYDPSSNTITLTYIKDNEYPLNLSSPALLLESMHKMAQDQGAQIMARMGEFQGRKVQVQEISFRNVGVNNAESHTATLYVDPHNKRLYAAQVSGVDAEGNVVIAGGITFNYPETGPQDIYDLGAPRDAKIVNNMPASDSLSILERYRENRDDATKKYLAVVAHNTAVNISDAVNQLDVDYKSGREERLERHEVFSRGEAFVELWPKYREQLGDSFESLWAWSRGHCETSGDISVRLYDGRYEWTTDRGDEGQWSALRKQPVSDGYLGALTPLREIGWPRIGSGGHVIEDSYAKEKGLICIESLEQGRASNGVVPPMRLLYYLDPGRDYLCQRHVIERRLDADWQQDKDWLADVDPNKVSDGSIRVEEITEAFQAPNGHWYPTVIVEQSTGIRKDYAQAPLRRSATRRIYLDLSPEFPEGIFDIDKLPGQ